MSKLDHQIQDRKATGDTLEQTRHNYGIQARMSESDDPTYGGINIDQSGRQGSAIASKQKESRSVSDMLMMNALTSSLADMENMMARKYGEDFDLQLAAEFLDDETFEKLASIQDIDQRREAVSQAIQEGIENGSIDPTKIEAFNSDFGNWLEERAENRQSRDLALEQTPENSVDMAQDDTLEQNAMAAFGPPSSPV